MKQTEKSPLDTANGNSTNWENRQLPAPGTDTALLLLQLPICAISSTEPARVLLSLASGKYPSAKMWQSPCPWKALGSIRSCNPIKFHQTSLVLIFKINIHLISPIIHVDLQAFWLYLNLPKVMFFCVYILLQLS